MLRRFLIWSVFAILCAHPSGASAGQLFPPVNVGACSNGMVLAWVNDAVNAWIQPLASRFPFGRSDHDRRYWR